MMTGSRRVLSGGRVGRRLVALLIGFLMATPGWAQDPGVITGTVVDARTQEPLADINVVVAGTLLGATTGPDGQFRIENVPPDTYTVQVNALGYRTARRSVEVPAGETVQTTFRLTPTAQRVQEEEVTVEAETLYPQYEVGERPLRGLNVTDPGRALRAVSGVGAGRYGALGYAPNVRGLWGTQISVYLDGVRAFSVNPLGPSAPLSPFDPSAAERIEVVTGPYALMWGPGNLSAIRLVTPAFAEQAEATGWLQGGFQGNGQVAETVGMMRGAALGMPFRAQAAYRTGQSYEAGNDATVPAHFEAGAAYGSVERPLTDVSSLSAWGGFQDQRDVRYPGLFLDSEFLRSGQGTVRYQLEQSIGLVRRVEVQAYAMQALQALNNDAKPTAQPGTLPDGGFRSALDLSVDAELQNFGGRLATRLAPLRGALLTVGADAYHLYQNATRSLQLRETGAVPPYALTDEVWPGVTTTNVGLFANGTRALGPVEASATGRLDLVRADVDRVSTTFLESTGLLADDLDAEEVNWSGALTLASALTPQWTLSLGVGSAARTADASERYVDRFPVGPIPTSAEVLGNPTLDAERGTQGDLWLSGAFERGAVQVGGFARRISDYITLVPTDIEPMLPTSPETVFRYVNGTATFYGLDASGHFSVNPLLTLRGRASYLWGQNKTLDEPVLGAIPLSAHLGAQAQVPFNEDIFLEGMLHLAAQHDRVATLRGDVPTDGYATLDLRLGFTPAASASLIFSVENVTDTYYVYPLNAQNPFTGDLVPEPGRRFGVNLRVTF